MSAPKPSHQGIARPFPIGSKVRDRLRAALEWMDRKGGLGLDVHERIRAALSPEPRCAVCDHIESLHTQADRTSHEFVAQRTESCTGGLGCCNPHGDCPQCGCAGKVERLTRDYEAAIESGAEELAESQRLRAALEKISGTREDTRYQRYPTLAEAQRIAREALCGEPSAQVTSVSSSPTPGGNDVRHAHETDNY